MVSFSSSTFVQTVSINYEDFNESFLTCGTCLCLYDAGNHSPKLLPCSHTICRQCLEQIVSSNPIPVTMLTSTPTPATVQNNEEHQHAFRCPICRENIPLPAGGVAALRPNFLVNQLLDLMAQQRREVVPKCSVHSVQELLFCESCDMVFCQDCNGSSHSTTPDLSEPHTVVPFSIAIKRMSEILLYKAKQCTKQLNEASGAVSAELAELDAHASATRAAVGAAFEEICDVVEERRQALMKDLDRMAIQKRAVLEAQMEEIRQERSLIEAEVDALHREVEVRSISGKISELTTKLETLGAVGEPRENSFLCFEPGSIRACLSAVRDCLSSFGAVRTSTTHPSLSSLVLPRCPVTNLECRAKVLTLDYDGRPRLTGNDPVEAKLFADGRELPVEVIDNEDGTYDLSFVPLAATEHRLEAKIFNRPLKDSPAFFVASPHINPEVSFGRRGRCDEEEFLQPVAAVYDGERKEILVLDSGNCRIKILSEERGEEDLLKCKRHVTEPSLEGASATGLAFCPDDGRVAVVNWRSRKITKFNVDGNGKRAEFTSDELKEPTGLAVASDGSVLVLDNSAGRVVLFSPEGKLERVVMLTNNASALAFGPDDEPIVACDGNKIRIYQRSGVVREIAAPKTKGSGSFGGLAVTGDTLLASRSEKQRNCVMVFDYPTGKLRFVVDSPEERLRRPAGIAVLPGGRFLVVDWGNDCVRKYRYC